MKVYPTKVPDQLIESLTHKNREDKFLADEWYRRQAVADLLNHSRREVELALTKIFYFVTVDWTDPVSRIYLIWVSSLLALVVVGATDAEPVGVRLPPHGALARRGESLKSGRAGPSGCRGGGEGGHGALPHADSNAD